MTSSGFDRAAIRRLRRGVVASSHLRSLSVGIDSLTRQVQGLLRDLRAGRVEGCFVYGEWGTGKTHLLSLIRDLCVESGIALTYLNLNGRGSALNHPQRFYHLIVNRIRVRGASPGLRSLFEMLAGDPGCCDRLKRWGFENRYRSEFGKALFSLLSVGLDSAPFQQWSILLGTDLEWADYSYKREKALQRIGDLGEFLNAVGMGGLVLELDELETVEQLWNVRSRIGAYSVLGRLTAMRYVLPCLAVTDRFHRLIDWDLKFKRIHEAFGLPVEARLFLDGWKRNRYPVFNPVMITPGLARELVEKIVDLYGSIYGPCKREVNPVALVDGWRKSPARSPRTLIRRAVYELDLARDGLQ